MHNPWQLVSLLVRPFYLWVVSRLINVDDSFKTQLNPKLPVVYVFPKKSLSDTLVLMHHCRQLNLPFPNANLNDIKKPGGTAIMHLTRMGWLQADRNKRPTTTFTRLASDIRENSNFDIQFVPVSIFWGKNPGREESSLFKLLFVDDQNAGILRKLFITIAQGRNVIVNIGNPLSAKEILAPAVEKETFVTGLPGELPGDQRARKLHRILRVHFQNVRSRVLGQKLYDRDQMIRRLVMAKPVQKIIQEEAQKRQSSRDGIELKAIQYAREIAADQTYAAVRFFEIILAWIWTKIFDGVTVKNFETVAEWSKTHEIVYVPNHRSHMDYLLVNYSLYHSGLPTPHTAAGINLNFWPIGGLLRRAGAFFLRRSFGGNRLYTAVFNEYIHYLATHNYPILFFPEGGRSRTGRLLVPKTGMLGMVVQSALRSSERPIALVPVYVGYDKVVEVSTYMKELGGQKKSKENWRQLLQATQILKKYYGRAYVGLGEPIDLNRFLDAQHPGWKEALTEDTQERPAWMPPLVTELARQLMVRVNQSAILSPISLVAMNLLAAPHRALPIEDLNSYCATLVNLQKAVPYSELVSVPEGSFPAHLNRISKLKSFQRFEHVGGDVIHLSDFDAGGMTYYRNNALHLFAVPALIARLFQNKEHFERQELIEAAATLFNFLHDELFLPWEPEAAPDVINRYIEGMIGVGLLGMTTQGAIIRPPMNSAFFGYLGHLGRSLGLMFERYMITANMLARRSEKGPVSVEDFENQCLKMAQRLAILNGHNLSESADKSYIKAHLQLLKRMGFIEISSDNKIITKPMIEDISRRAELLLNQDTQHSIERITTMH